MNNNIYTQCCLCDKALSIKQETSL